MAADTTVPGQMIDGPDDVKVHFGLSRDDTWGTLQKAIFTSTDCGAFIERVEPNDGVGETFGIAVGSIVEGSDEQTETHYLYYPFSGQDLSKALDAVEEEAAELWEDANGDHDTPDDHPGFSADFLTF